MELLGVLSMNSIKWKMALYIILFIVTGVSLVNWVFSNQIFTFQFIIDCIEKSVTIISILSVIFCKWIWKWKVFKNWLVVIPDLNGKWTGVLSSNWVDSTTEEKISSKITTLIIKQSLFKTSCVVKTDESTSYSILSEFWIDEDNQILRLVYTYQNEPRQNVQSRSRIHFGTAVLDINLGENEKLEGYYWTNRNSSGEMMFNCHEKTL